MAFITFIHPSTHPSTQEHAFWWSIFFFLPVILSIYYPSKMGASPPYLGSLLILALEELASDALLCVVYSLSSPSRLLELVVVLLSRVYGVMHMSISAKHIRPIYSALCPFHSTRELKFAFRLSSVDDMTMFFWRPYNFWAVDYSRYIAKGKKRSSPICHHLYSSPDHWILRQMLSWLS